MRPSPQRPYATMLALALLALPLLHACGTENGMVGGECRPQYTRCDDVCVDLSHDDRHCGACDNACAAGVRCGASVCGGPLDASKADADQATDAGDPLDDGSSRSRLDAGDASDASAPGDACVPPFDDPNNCGACGVQCTTEMPICRAGDGGFACAPICETPLTNCNGTCVDVVGDDPYHCGTCSRFCPSFLCAAGVCEGTTPGEIVVIGHDYSDAVAGTSQLRVLHNAISIAARNPIRILSYEQWARAADVQRVKTLLAGLPRALTITASNTPADLQSATLAATYDVVLVFDQADADAAEATALGAAAKTALHDFASVGGVIVALDGAAGQGHMPELLSASELLAVSAHTPIFAGTPVFVTRVGDLVTNQVTSTYGVADRTVRFTTSEPDVDPVRWVIRAGPQAAPGEPVVVRKTVSLP